ncbi:choice-of-anchor D domain-containing protein [Fulvivirga lutea]|uniref:Choice-of-anchor D domain-containing protein n=1 Tax=Fulvivirga lutea TaxID=2810512 RepID=A0A974WIA4_9BACT|nr:choice-of-anchor D domain-containing protein [Fulvivirga lutea]QSE99058.1 choice-of-anchor D domain-containing protein [Fulvivirga lutea]
MKHVYQIGYKIYKSAIICIVGFLCFLAAGNSFAQVVMNSGDYYPNSTVQCIVEDADYIYISGQFTNFSDGTNDVPLVAIARFDKTTFTLDQTWDLQVDYRVYAMAIDGDFLYIGGDFESVLGSTRNNLAKINKSGGTPTLESWDPAPDAPVRAIEITSDAIFVGGNFANISATARNAVAKFDLNTGNHDTGFNANIRVESAYAGTGPGIIWTMVSDEANSALYVGGGFNRVGASTISNAAKLDITDGSAETWTPDPDRVVYDLELVGTNDIIICGIYANIGGESIKSLAKVDRTTGVVDATWNPNPQPRNGNALAIASIGTDLYAGGGFTSIGGVALTRLARITTTGTGATDESWSLDNGGSINYMISSGDYIYLGGNFSSLDGDATVQRFGVVYVAPAEIDIQGDGNGITNGDNTPDLLDGTNMGSVTIGSSGLSTFSIENTGSETLEISNIQFTGADATDFSHSGITLPTTISGLSNATFDIVFSPSASGSRTATIEITSDDADEGTYTFDISGVGLTPAEINVQGNGNDITSGDDTPDAVDGTDLGILTIGSSTSSTFTIQNSGESELNLSAITLSGANAADFSVDGITVPLAVSGGGSTSFSVTFNPAASGISTATIEITNDDADEGIYTFDVTGVGQTPAQINLQGVGLDIDIANGDDTPDTSDGTDIGPITIGFTSGTAFDIQNLGEATLTVSEFVVGGANASEFSINAITTPAVILGGESTSFDVLFTPVVSGTRTATITIISDDPEDGSFTFTVAALGQTPGDINIQGGGIDIVNGDDTPDAGDNTDFGTVTVGLSASTVYTIQNTGDLGLNVSSVTISGTNASDYTISDITTPFDIDGGLSTTFTVTFNPSSAGARVATIEVISNDSDEGTYTFDISGIGEEEVTGVDLEIASDFQMYPNPAANIVKIELSQVNEKVIGISFISLNGTKSGIRSNFLVNGQFIEVDVSELKQGAYLLEIQTESRLLQSRFIKN